MMAANGCCLLIVASLSVYFCFLFPREQQPTWYTRWRGRGGMSAHIAWDMEFFFVAARKAVAANTSTEEELDNEKQKDRWFLSPFKRFKYRWWGWTPVDRIVAGVNMDAIYLLAGEAHAHIPRVIQATLDDLMILFFRWFDETNLVWPLQREVTKAALFRQHYRYTRQFLHEVTASEQHSPAADAKSVTTVQDYQEVAAAHRRRRSWFFDGNSFFRRGKVRSRNGPLTEDDIDFMRGLPFSVLRISRGVFAPSMPTAVARLSEELEMRGIKTADELLEKSSFVDFFALFDIFDEAYTQVDILREFHRNWENEAVANLPQHTLPYGEWTEGQNLTALIVNPKTSVAEFPKCSTLKCYMGLKWSSTPPRFITVEKKDVNSLKLLLVGNSGVAETPASKDVWWMDKLKHLFGFDELQQTVAALKDWHAREKVDAVLGLGNFLGIPAATSVRSKKFETKWYNIFVKDGGLDVPWLMTIGEEEGLLSPATQIRYHYTLQHPNWHLPNDMYTVVFQFQADMTLKNGTIQRDAFNVTVVNLNTWALLPGNPLTNNIQTQLSRLTWISRELLAATKRNSTWLLVMGHHPLVSTGVEGKQARLQYLEDIYGAGHYRGWEHLMLHHLLFHYQVDAYISGHDYLMEYHTMENLDNNATISFINSGATARLMGRTIGRGWIGRLRGALYPFLCFVGRRVFFLADPGGCEPRGYEKSDAVGWFGPKFGNYKINILERVVRATGFTSLQLTKDHMIVEFIDGRTKKPATRRMQRRSNKTTRDISFANIDELGRKMYEEVHRKREAFARANVDLLRKEIYFAKRCPVLAERLATYIREVNSMTDRYNNLRREKEVFQRMTETEIEEAAALGLDRDLEIDRAIVEMRAVSKCYHSLKEKYLKLLAIKEKLPPRDDPRYEELLQHEKTMMNLQRSRISLIRRQGTDGVLAAGEQYALLEEKIASVSATIDNLEKRIEHDLTSTSTPTRDKQKSQQNFEDAKEALIARLRKAGRQIRQVQDSVRAVPQGAADTADERATRIKQQLDVQLKDLHARRELYLEPLHPAVVWQKQQDLHRMEARLKHVRYQLSWTRKKTSSAATTAEEGVNAINQNQRELQELEAKVQKAQQLLKFRHLTPLQQQYLDKKAALEMAELVEAQGAHLGEAERDIPRVQRALHLAKQATRHLRSELEQLGLQVEEELQKAVTEWERNHDVQEGNKRQRPATAQGETRDRTRFSHVAETAVSGRPGKQETKTDVSTVKAGLTPETATIERRRLSEKLLTDDTRGNAHPVEENDSSEFREEEKNKSSETATDDTLENSAPVVSGKRQSSVSQSQKAVPQDRLTPDGILQRSGPASRESKQTSRESLLRPALHRSQIRPANSEEPEEEARELQGPTASSGRTAEMSAGSSQQTSGTPASAEAAKNDHKQGTEEKAQHRVAGAREPSEAGSSPKKTASAVVNDNPAEVTRQSGQKKGPSGKAKDPIGSTVPRVPDATPFEGENLEEELDKIDIGPMDACHSIPLLDVLVRRALHPEDNAERDAECEKLFADSAQRRQLVTLSNNLLLSRSIQGMGASLHPVPSVHVSRGWRLYFQDTPKIMFKALLKKLKAGLSFVYNTFQRSTDVAALRQKLREKQEVAPETLQNNTALLSVRKSKEGSDGTGSRATRLSLAAVEAGSPKDRRASEAPRNNTPPTAQDTNKSFEASRSQKTDIDVTDVHDRPSPQVPENSTRGEQYPNEAPPEGSPSQEKRLSIAAVQADVSRSGPRAKS